MNKLSIAFALTALIALGMPVLHAQESHAQDPGDLGRLSQSAYDMQQNELRMRANWYNDLQHGDRQTSINSLANLTKLREKLAEAWQTLGLSPPVAKAVAAAYQPNFSLNSRRASLLGKSDEEIAALIQSSLAKKDYLLANQTLIDLQTKRMKLGTGASPDGMH
ncbi:hypothetical protein IMW82_15125 [Rhodanobacter sp. B2A1Ga4]|uniref:hypothetical protein n=1 Tax=Rhodanobacter sp. B2A1Ga4 TaxID=2778647 RepID=UPI001B396FE1|nr:hypothetical protein [Rhodanobacter sp. B2A1Ga4]MBQ4856000.1 hypothetical protein [Rhodanobacter sp. B2A1Ga4]